MKNVLLSIAICLAMVSPALADTRLGKLGWMKCRYMNTVYDFGKGLTKKALEENPEWSLEEDFPPLPPRKAVKIALAQALSLRSDVTEWEMLSVQIVNLNKYDGTNEGTRWIYVVHFNDRTNSLFGVRSPFSIPVLMNGTTITPVIEEREN